MRADEVFQRALDLPPKDRAELARKLLESLDLEETDAETDPDPLDEEMEDELVRRLDDLRSGRVKGLTYEEFKARMDALDKELTRKEARRSRSSSTRKRIKK